MDVKRLEGNPIVTGNLDEALDENVNGPSLVRAPSWIDDPPGKYYLYFADHAGDSIRLAFADELTGEWRLQASHPLEVDTAGPGFDDHIASPDVHVDEDEQRVRLYYHGCCAHYEDDTGEANQFTRVATSRDGRSFTAHPEPLGRFYFRVFEYDGYYYALAKENRGEDQGASGQRLYRSTDALSGFEPGPLLLADGSRHTAVRRRGETLDVYYSRIGDAPERILHTTLDLTGPWTAWEAEEPETVLEPEREWEGAAEPVKPSRSGSALEPVHELRDPAVYHEDGRTYLLYTVAGERGIAIAELVE
jgi:hypothetical protein